MTRDDMRIIAKVLAQHRDSQAGTSIGSTVAMITCDLSDAFRKDDPDFEYLEFWSMVEDARRLQRRLDAEWLAGARARMGITAE